LMRTGASRFIISAGQQDGYTISYLTAGLTGTDISNVDVVSGCGLYGTAGVAELSNVEQYTEFSIVGDLAVPEVRDVTGVKQTDKTHFCVHGTKNTGPAGTDVLTGQGNNPEQFIHIDDVPIMKAFTIKATGYGSPNSRLKCYDGLFSQHDPGNIVLFEDGSESLIEYLCDKHGVRVYTPTSLYAIGDGNYVPRQSAVMGSDTVFTCSKTGHTVTLISGARGFAATDIRKPIFWADGTVDWITGYTDANTITTLESSTKASQGVAIDPTSRKFCDISTDTPVLSSRIKGFTTQHRGRTSLPECDLGVIIQGFLAVALRGTNTIHYSPMTTAQKYLVGYYHAGLNKYSEIADEIQFLLSLPDKLVVVCAQSTWNCATNTPRESKRPDLGVTVPLLPMFTLIDEVGCTAIGSIRKLGIGLYSMITSEPAHRLFDGFKFGDNLANEQVMETLKSINTFTYSQYDEISGLKMWGAKEL